MSMQRRGIKASKGFREVVIPEQNIGLFKDFCTFSKRIIECKDIDPMYPVLKDLYDQKGLSKNESLWMTYLYVASYHIGCAESAWDTWKRPMVVLNRHIKWEFSTGTERRLFRGRQNHYIQNINEFVSKTGGDIEGWLSSISPYGEHGWERVRKEFEKIKYNGSWASYKWADLLKHVHGYNITANDIGVGGGSATAGPVPGMVKLTGYDWRKCAVRVDIQKALMSICIREGVPFDGLDQLETALCDFNSLIKGKYYVGHDIDMQMEQMSHSKASLWEARGNAIPDNYRGEVCGWFGVRKDRCSIYKQKGIIL